MNNENIFYNFNKILSYGNAIFYFIIGERGVGKSYGIKKYVTNRFIKKGKEFAYIRRYKSEIEEAMKKNNHPIFFEQIKKEFPNYELTNTKDVMKINNKICGYAIPLSIAHILKSSSYENVDTIIFDEFIIDKGCYHYLRNEVEQMLDLVETIGRLRPIKVFFIGNAISITNPYFTYFDLSLPYNSEFKTFNDGLIVVNYIKNEKYREIKKNTKFGKLIKNTEYGKYAIDNQMLRDSKTFIMKKGKHCKFFFKLKIGIHIYGIWNDYTNECMIISNNYDTNSPLLLCINPEDHNDNTLLIKIRGNSFFKCLIDNYRMGLLRFENQKIKNDVMNYLNKYLTY